MKAKLNIAITSYGTPWDMAGAIACRNALKEAAAKEIDTNLAKKLQVRAEWWDAVIMELRHQPPHPGAS